eukprot:5516492-Amphidinium_carterae.1
MRKYWYGDNRNLRSFRRTSSPLFRAVLVSWHFVGQFCGIVYSCTGLHSRQESVASAPKLLCNLDCCLMLGTCTLLESRAGLRSQICALVVSCAYVLVYTVTFA